MHRIGDVKTASRCRSRVLALGYDVGTSRKKHKLRDISSTALCIGHGFPFCHDLDVFASGDAAVEFSRPLNTTQACTNSLQVEESQDAST